MNNPAATPAPIPLEEPEEGFEGIRLAKSLDALAVDRMTVRELLTNIASTHEGMLEVVKASPGNTMIRLQRVATLDVPAALVQAEIDKLAVNTYRGQVWANAIYWWSKAERDSYNAASGIPANPIAAQLGMSGECGCGAYAQPGELARWRAIDPAFGQRIDRLQEQCLARGFTWGWEGKPPKGGAQRGQMTLLKMPMCVGCEKSAIVQEEIAAQEAA